MPSPFLHHLEHVRQNFIQVDPVMKLQHARQASEELHYLKPQFDPNEPIQANCRCSEEGDFSSLCKPGKFSDSTCRTMMYNSRRAESYCAYDRPGDKYNLPFSGHLFGAGKTRLGREVLVQAKRLYERDDGLKQTWDELYTKEGVETFFNAKRVEINFELWDDVPRKALSLALADFVYTQFVLALGIKESRPADVRTLRQVVQWVRKVANLSGLYLHIDEVLLSLEFDQSGVSNLTYTRLVP
eukprot:TRINITY_DN14540_c0_g1_i1.p1 TRINITY_DN14540_c0_g1~~TRINITY_DN14540_c0_g1_i1.p1  ORF type:complete len:242 (+),score=18.38 TRINITY_DN14540_c0_g1_i1:94-819(+)